MALDEPKASDNVYSIGDYQFIVDKEFMEKAKPVKVDFSKFGFAISSSIELGGGCGGCGGGDASASDGCGDAGSCCGS
jgi:iron-sulfur cluster assembly protein